MSNRSEQLINRFTIVQGPEHDTSPAYRAREILKAAGVSYGTLYAGIMGAGAALLREVPEGTENLMLSGAAILLAGGILNLAYIPLHWNSDKLPHKVAARRLQKKEAGLKRRHNAARTLLAELNNDSRLKPLYFKDGSEEEWVLDPKLEERYAA